MRPLRLLGICITGVLAGGLLTLNAGADITRDSNGSESVYPLEGNLNRQLVDQPGRWLGK